jgi:hypothetical protein
MRATSHLCRQATSRRLCLLAARLGLHAAWSLALHVRCRDGTHKVVHCRFDFHAADCLHSLLAS